MSDFDMFQVQEISGYDSKLMVWPMETSPPHFKLTISDHMRSIGRRTVDINLNREQLKSLIDYLQRQLDAQ